jgi:tetratricopeptide (TPR) repeat protein
MDMFATSYSFLPKPLPSRVLGRRLLWLMLIWMAGIGYSAPAATNTPAGPAAFRAYAAQKLAGARKRLHDSPTNAQALLEFAQAGFDLGEFSKTDSERAALAEECIAVCRPWVAREPKSAPAHYYLGMNLGQLARTKFLGALKIVDEMEREFQAAEKLDVHFDHAGPVRNLGLLYRDAPAWGSIGNRGKARTYLKRAIELEPDFPENRLNYLEACLQWVDWAGAAREMKQLDAIWDLAQTSLSGPAWDSSWWDWRKRRAEAKTKIEEGHKLGSPKQKQ